MRGMSRRLPLSTATVAAILRRLTPDECALIERLRAATGKPVLEFWERKLGSGWGVCAGRGSPERLVWVVAINLWEALEHEQEADALAAETARAEAAETTAGIDAAVDTAAATLCGHRRPGPWRWPLNWSATNSTTGNWWTTSCG
jgi:hypothetical protein